MRRLLLVSTLALAACTAPDEVRAPAQAWAEDGTVRLPGEYRDPAGLDRAERAALTLVIDGYREERLLRSYDYDTHTVVVGRQQWDPLPAARRREVARTLALWISTGRLADTVVFLKHGPRDDEPVVAEYGRRGYLEH